MAIVDDDDDVVSQQRASTKHVDGVRKFVSQWLKRPSLSFKKKEKRKRDFQNGTRVSTCFARRFESLLHLVNIALFF